MRGSSRRSGGRSTPGHRHDLVLIAPQRTLEIKPRPSTATAMTKVGAASNVHIALVIVVCLAIRGFGAKGTLLEDDVTRGYPGLLEVVNAAVGAILQNLVGRNVHVVVTGHEDFGADLLVLMLMLTWVLMLMAYYSFVQC